MSASASTSASAPRATGRRGLGGFGRRSRGKRGRRASDGNRNAACGASMSNVRVCGSIVGVDRGGSVAKGGCTTVRKGVERAARGAPSAAESSTRASALSMPEAESGAEEYSIDVNGRELTLQDISWTRCVEEIARGDPGCEYDYRGVVFKTPEGGFIMGQQKTLYHLEGCPCPTCNVFRCRVREGADHNGVPVNVVVISQSEFNTLKSVGEFKDMSQVEKLRRRKIGKANAGKVPWNKGGKHSKETIEKIRATTLKHMANPEYRERLKKSYSGNNARHSAHTRAKIKRASVDRARAKKIERLEEESSTVWGRKMGNNGAVSSGLFCRRSSGVMTVRFGVNGATDMERLRQRHKDEEKVRQQEQRALKKQIVAKLVEKRKELRKAKVKAPRKRSSEHRAKISQAIADKWRDPEYVAKMRRQRKSSTTKKKPSSTPKRIRIDPAKTKLLKEINGMYEKADSALRALRARERAGVAVDPAMMEQAVNTQAQTRAMMEKVQRTIDIEIDLAKKRQQQQRPEGAARPR